MKRKHLLLVFGSVVAIGFGWAVIAAIASLDDYEYGENVASVDWLPERATNVSFFRSYSFTAYEFDIDEQGFRAWAADWPTAEIDTAQSIRRYGFAYDKWHRVPYPDEDFDAQNRMRARHEASIHRGWLYRLEQTDGGGVTVAYDRDAKRAYYQSSPR